MKQICTLGAAVILSTGVAAQDVPVTAENVTAPETPYSPYAGRNFPTQVLWGDTHLHTANSLDARSLGVTLTVEDAYRFARGEEVTATHGQRLKLSRPLDFLVVSDHSDAMGAMNEIIAGNPDLMRDPLLRDWNQRLSQGGEVAFNTAIEVVETFAGVTGVSLPDIVLDPEFVGSVWRRYLETAEAYNDPGRFTTVIGYEWTSTEGGNNLHRNVLYRDGADVARLMNPYTTAESFNPEDLWTWMETYEETTGGRVLALAHNGNLSNGIMFPVETNPATGRPLTTDYATRRMRWEPLYEITQIKGDGEAHPYLSPNDEFADYGTWDWNNLGPVPKEQDMLQYEYVREALKNGLLMEEELGVNPYKFGVVGSTDSHTALSTAEEDGFFGKHSGVEPDAERMQREVGHFGDSGIHWTSWDQVSSGYAAVWATENTREAIFDAMRRKEVYATTGPRMTVWFFGGWDFEETDAQQRAPGRIGYSKGVSMGGDLAAAPDDRQSPTFLVAAMKDPYSGNLDRIQIVKGWLDNDGNTQEQVYNVAWSGERNRRPNGMLPAVGNTVDINNATWTNTIGAAELITVWEDPDFDADQRAVYYARVIEIPTPHWTAYDAVRFDVPLPADAPRMNQERAYTSPIWYTP